MNTYKPLKIAILILIVVTLGLIVPLFIDNSITGSTALNTFKKSNTEIIIFAVFPLVILLILFITSLVLIYNFIKKHNLAASIILLTLILTLITTFLSVSNNIFFFAIIPLTIISAIALTILYIFFKGVIKCIKLIKKNRKIVVSIILLVILSTGTLSILNKEKKEKIGTIVGKITSITGRAVEDIYKFVIPNQEESFTVPSEKEFTINDSTKETQFEIPQEVKQKEFPEIPKNVTKNITIPTNISQPLVENKTNKHNALLTENRTIGSQLIGKSIYQLKENPTFELKFYKGNITNKIKRTDFNIQEDAWSNGNETIKVYVYKENQSLEDSVKIEEVGYGNFKIIVEKKREFEVGKYTLVIESEGNGETITQEQTFLWGVLAINTNKAAYTEREQAFIGIAVLDEAGKMVCDALLFLDITHPSGTKTRMSTDEGTITVSPECLVYGITSLPDYYTYYNITSNGTYLVNLTAVTKMGVNTVEDKFTVFPSLEYDIERVGPTRIYPISRYQMNITIKTREDKATQVVEYIPTSFKVTPLQKATVEIVNNTKQIKWDVESKANKPVYLAYEFDAPDKSPYFYLLGRLHIADYEEQRYWQLASDANDVPNVTLNAPANGSSFILNNFNIILNASMEDTDLPAKTRMYGVSSADTTNFYKHGFIFQNLSSSSGTNITYNWTSPVIVPDADTVVLYHLDNNSNFGENQTGAYDFVSANVNLTVQGNAAPNVSGGRFAGGWIFDGKEDYISDTGDKGALNGIDNATLSVWVRRAGASSTSKETVIKEGAAVGYILTANCNNNMIQFAVRVGGVTYAANASSSLITDGNWHHLAGVYDGDANNVYVYVDGSLKNTTAADVDVTDPTIGIRIGGAAGGIGNGATCDGTTTASSFNGTIDDVGIWNKSLAEREIKDLYRLKAGKYFWKVNITDNLNNTNESATREFTINHSSVPYTTLNNPANASLFALDIFNITLNVTIVDDDGEAQQVSIYVVNSTDTANTYDYIIYRNDSVANGTQITYNLTTLPIDSRSDGLVLLVHFDNNSKYGENGTRAYDASLFRNNGTGAGTTNPKIEGKIAGAWEFQGIGQNDYFKFPDIAQYDNVDSYTFAAWIYAYSNGSNGIIVSKNMDVATGGSFTGGSLGKVGKENQFEKQVTNNGYILFINYTIKGLRFYGGVTEGVDVRADNAFNLNEWVHVAYVNYFDPDGLPQFFVNGKMVATSGGIVDIFNNNNNDLWIGATDDQNSPSGGFNGSIDEVAIWNRSLTREEIENVYRLTADKYFWKINVTDTNASDQKQNTNESETREFVVRDSELKITQSKNCSSLAIDANTSKFGYTYGYTCSNTNYATCVGLNANLILLNGTLTLNETCNLIFNGSGDGALILGIKSRVLNNNIITSQVTETGELNITGANITSSDAANKFNFTFYTNREQAFPRINYGNFSFAYFTNATNITDSSIKFINITIVNNRTILLNSTDIEVYAIIGGSLERRSRVNITTYSAGSTVSSANVTARNVSNSTIASKLTGSDGAAYFNLTQYLDTGSGKTHYNNYTINVTKAGYVKNSTGLNLTNDTDLKMNMRLVDVIEVSTTETLPQIFTRINNGVVFNNVSTSSRSCVYASTAAINITTGTLIMESCTLEINSSSEGQYYIEVGGTIRANYSNITWSNNEKRYHFYTTTGAAVKINNSAISFTGSADLNNKRGFAINTDNLTFDNNTIRQATVANIELKANNVELTRSTFLGPSGVAEYNLYIISNSSKVIDSNISGVAAIDYDVFIGTNNNVTLLNTNYSTHNVQSGGYLYKQWYVNVLVQNSTGDAIYGAVVNFYNITRVLKNNATTNTSGHTNRVNVTEYIGNGSNNKIYQTNYTINASNSTFATGSRSINVTNSINITFTLSDNQAPTNVTLLTPANASSGTNRTPTLDWSDATDPEADTITYKLEVDDSSTFDAPEANVTTTTSTYTTNQLDVDTVYYWRVIANDSYGDSPVSDRFQFTIDSVVSAALTTSAVTFSSLNPEQQDNTYDNSPNPFVIQNDGNAFVNISVNATAALWETQELSTAYFQFSANETSETGSFNKSLSNLTWTNVPPITGSAVAISDLNWTNSNDSAEIEIKIEAPIDEPPGSKTSTINLVARLASKSQ